MTVFSTMPDHPDAPGCYGSALTFKADSTECRSCQFADRCGPLSNQRLLTLRARLGIVEKPARRTFKAPEPETPQPVAPQPAAATGPTLTPVMPKKIEDLLARFERAGVIFADMAKGKNPFALRRKPEFMFVACHLVMRLERGISREQLRQVYEKRFDWTPATAAAHATQAAQVLAALGVCHDANGILTMKRI